MYVIFMEAHALRSELDHVVCVLHFYYFDFAILSFHSHIKMLASICRCRLYIHTMHAIHNRQIQLIFVTCFSLYYDIAKACGTQLQH